MEKPGGVSYHAERLVAYYGDNGDTTYDMVGALDVPADNAWLLP